MKKYLIAFLGVASLAGILLGGSVAWALLSPGLFPISDGVYQEWLPITSSTHYTLIDEKPPCNGNADYVWTTTSSKRESYGVSLASVPATSTVTGIRVGICASSHFATGATSVVQVFYRWNGVDVFPTSTYELSGSLTPVVLPVTFFPPTFLPVSTSTMEMGVVYVTGTRGVRVSGMRAQLEY